MVTLADLNKGFLLPRIQDVMDFLSEEHPPQQFPADDLRVESDAAPTWLRGGTSPSGEEFGDVSSATWFIGETYLGASYGMPQRIVWLPPELGEERYTYPDTPGWHNEREQVGGEGPGNSAGQEARGFRRVMTRVVPVRIDIWANDYGDMDILINAVAAAVFLVNAGAAAEAGELPVSGGGGVPLHTGQRGLRYQMTCHFVFPVTAPYKPLVKGRSVAVGVRMVQPPEDVRGNRAVAEEKAEARREGERFPSDLDVSPWKAPRVRRPPREEEE